MPPPYYGQPHDPWQTRPQPSGAVAGIGWASVVAALLVIVSAFLTWASFKGGGFDFTANGMGQLSSSAESRTVPDRFEFHGGQAAVALGVAAMILGILRGLRKAALGAAIVALVMGAICGIIALGNLGDVSNTNSELSGTGVTVGAGAGLYLLLLGAGALFVLGIVGIVKRR